MRICKIELVANFLNISLLHDLSFEPFRLNLVPMGNINRLTAHGGCPVLVGSKWITNKWIGYHDQWEYLKCGLGASDRNGLFNRWRKNL